MTTDYRNTVFLPRTDFSMKAKLPEREPLMLERWKKLELHEKLREVSKGRK